MIEYIKHIDTSLFFLINEKHNPTWDIIMKNISGKLQWIPVYIYIIIMAFYKMNWKKAILFVLITLITVGISDLISYEFFKDVFKRYRPGHNIDIKNQVHLIKNANGELDRGGLYGFVSSHAANFFAIATMIAFSFKWNRIWFFGAYIVASIVAYSRVYLGRHYPLDVFCGAVLGCVIAYFAYIIFVQVSKKINLH